MAETVYIYVSDAAVDGEPVDNVFVGLYDNTTKALLQSDMSGSGEEASGQTTFTNVDPGTYEIRIQPSFPSAVVDGKVQRIVVLDAPTPPLSNIFDVAVTSVGLPTATNPRLCRCSGYIVDMAGDPVPNALIRFSDCKTPILEHQSESPYSMKIVSPVSRTITTDSNGYTCIDLYRKASYTVYMSGFENLFRTVDVPDLAAVNLGDLLFPIASSVEYYDAGTKLNPTQSPTTTVSLADGGKQLTITLTLRSGVLGATEAVRLVTSDESVLAVAMAGDQLTIIPVAAGTATITPERAVIDDLGINVSNIPDMIGNLVVTVTE